MLLKLSLFLLTAFSTDLSHGSISDQAPVQVQLAHNSATEQQAKKQLMDLFATYPDMVKWIYTKDVIIDDSTYIPHSHPVLTINTSFLDNDLQQLATFVHEQLHWLEMERSAQRELAIVDFKEVYPDVPARGGMGGRDVYSTYLHLVVCDLEFQALTALLGEKKARILLADKSYYRWIYDKVLTDERVRQVNAKYGFILE